MMVILPFY